MPAKPEDELYAVASYDTKLPDPGPVTTLIVHDVKLEVYDTAMKRPVHTFTASNEDRASGSLGLRILTGLTLFIISPITSCRLVMFTKGTQVTLTPVPQAGRTFVGWSGACSGADPCTLLMDGNKGIGATFQ